MGALIIFLITLAVIFGGLGLTLMVVYNRLVVLRNRYANAFAQIDVQLRRRYDLVPGLVESVRGYLAHERGTLEAVTAARDSAAGARLSAAADPSQVGALALLGRADQALAGALGRLTAVVESYPDLKADKVVAQLMEDLLTAENRVGFARQAYNDAVMEFNQAREMFPAVLFAGLFGFQEAAAWTLTGPGAEAPKAALKP
jgi:LemA protein